MFFEYNQNNSGGSFAFEDNAITHYVIVEADSAEEANRRAEEIGLYFDGDGDCSCCGDRWYEQWDDRDGDKVPSIYGTPIQDFDFSFKWMGDRPEAYVHFADGRVQGYGFETKVLG
ncbi:hypothetical protein SEA_YOSIF_70 [Streptomyces phage Yosif]|uniref:DUF7296 domain-containing protein n=1 Tax=Streptomyces phage Yosif TaxID=2201421 RepID=A0A2Z4QC07_9CAUD|nr:hypothetical protein KGG71_gp70 [Streptomyces phage Yosif]AWY07634.1 hypothetical protein SEA_YOSIF_70 [Streptomyces phage Yosif]